MLAQWSFMLAATLAIVALVTGLTLWRTRVAGSWLTSAFLIEALWAADNALGLFGTVLSHYLDLFRSAVWLLVMVASLASLSNRRGLRSRGVLVATGMFVSLAVFTLFEFLARQQILQINSDAIIAWTGVLTAIVGLILLEQVVRNMRAGREWQLKYLWLGVGCFFTFDLCMWSAGLLQGMVSNQWMAARGAVSAAGIALILVALQRIPFWDRRAFTAPKIVYFTASLVATGVYLVTISIFSIVLRQLTGDYGAAMQAVFVVAAMIVLVVALLSEQVRAWLRITSSKYLLPYHYNYRAEWLKLTETLSIDSADPERYEKIARMVAGLANSASASLWVVNEQEELMLVGGNLHSDLAVRVPSSGEFFQFLQQRDWIEDLHEARLGNRATPVPPAPDWLSDLSSTWLVVPLINLQKLVGIILVAEPLVPMHLGWEQLDILRVSGRQIASHLALEQAAKRLAEGSRFQALNQLATFLMHDLRHLIAQQALVVENAARHRGNPEFVDDAILTIESSVKRMNRLMEQLRSGAIGESSRRVELADACAEVAKRCQSGLPRPQLLVEARPLDVLLDRDRFVQVLEHLVRNAQDATAATGSVELILRRASQKAVIEIVDNGAGMDATFVRDRLFRPFDTTKGAAGMGIGAYEARDFVRRAGGTVEVESHPGRGTRFRVLLPLLPELSISAQPL